MKQPDKKTLSVDLLVLDAGTQSRAAISEETVQDYADILESFEDKTWPFPEVDVFQEGDRYLVSAGFHRTLAAIQVGRASIPCAIYQGTPWDAFLHGIAANRDNPLRPNSADKRFMVHRLLDSRELTQQQIAEIIGVSLRTVARIASERKPHNQPIVSQANNVPLAHLRPSLPERPSDPFDAVDPFGAEGEGDASTEAAGQEAHAEVLPPRTPRIGTEEPGGNSNGKVRTPAEEFTIQKSKTVKTAEALGRAFCDLNDLKKSGKSENIVATCLGLVGEAKNWPK